MTLDKAIEILAQVIHLNPTAFKPDTLDAFKLGIEALKRTSTRREKLGWKCEPLLPGEE